MKNIMIMIVMMLLFIGTASAQGTMTQENLGELSVMQTSTGAEIRFLQLENSIERNILQADEVIAKILEIDPDADISGLEDMVAELESLLDEVRAVDLEQDPSNIMELFLQYKDEAKDITSEFRTLARSFISEEEREQLKLEMQVQEKNTIQSRIKNLINQYNAMQAKNMLKTMGVTDDISQRIQEGQMSKNMIMQHIAEKYNSLTREQQMQAKQTVHEAQVKAAVYSYQVMEKVQNQFQMNDADSGMNKGTQSGRESQNTNTGDSDNGNNDGISGGDNTGSDSSGSDNGGSDNGGSDSSGGDNGGTNGGSGGNGGGNGGGK